ncbi:PREDICTED: prostaglandin E2 receptor EP3 subtype [Tinamus guttatus]|uniref:prostaglandin E2 receptor EP3 subtype n=1 Tax=Tinamus guttatus TaxID=94827 RepID=UPI00052E8CBC|nr:PREDICTED: prostaglandin E2 receptor EP3 subtype [Tinamus guttatus]
MAPRAGLSHATGSLRVHMKTRVTRLVLLSIWLAVLLFALLPVAGVGRYTLQWPGTWGFISTGDDAFAGSIFFASTFAFLGLSSLFVTMACNLATIEALVSRCRSKATASHSSKQWGRIATETLLQLLGIMCVLSACWSPLLVGVLLSPTRGPARAGLGVPGGSQELRVPGKTALSSGSRRRRRQDREKKVVEGEKAGRGEITMLKMIFSHTSFEHCNGFGSAAQGSGLHKECNFFLTAVRLASLNQILDPWVYLLLRKILLQKFCQAASAVSKCSNNEWKERSITLSEEIRRTTA